MTAIATSNTLSPYITKNPQSSIRTYACHARLYCVAAIICGIAATAILGALTAIYLGLLSIQAISSGWTLAGSFVGFCISMHGLSKFSEWKKWAHFEIAILERVVEKLKTIETWTESNVQGFLKQHGIDCSRYTEAQKQLLAKQKPQAPLTALLPLIARYLALQDICLESQAIIDKQTQAIAQLGNDQLWIKRHNDVKDEYTIRLSQSRRVAAFYLECLANPSSPTPSNVQDVLRSLNSRKQPAYSPANQFWNLLYYRQINPDMSPILSARGTSPREVHRLLFRGC